jgi:hypothetical protein
MKSAQARSFHDSGNPNQRPVVRPFDAKRRAVRRRLLLPRSAKPFDFAFAFRETCNSPFAQFRAIGVSNQLRAMPIRTRAAISGESLNSIPSSALPIARRASASLWLGRDAAARVDKATTSPRPRSVPLPAFRPPIADATTAATAHLREAPDARAAATSKCRAPRRRTWDRRASLANTNRSPRSFPPAFVRHAPRLGRMLRRAGAAWAHAAPLHGKRESLLSNQPDREGVDVARSAAK